MVGEFLSDYSCALLQVKQHNGESPEISNHTGLAAVSSMSTSLSELTQNVTAALRASTQRDT